METRAEAGTTEAARAASKDSPCATAAVANGATDPTIPDAAPKFNMDFCVGPADEPSSATAGTAKVTAAATTSSG